MTHSVKLTLNLEQIEEDMKHYLTRNMDFGTVMRMRCTRGLSIHTFPAIFLSSRKSLILVCFLNL